MIKLIKYMFRLILFTGALLFIVWLLLDSSGKRQMENMAQEVGKEVLTAALEHVGQSITPDTPITYSCREYKYGKYVWVSKTCPSGTPKHVCCN